MVLPFAVLEKATAARTLKHVQIGPDQRVSNSYKHYVVPHLPVWCLRLCVIVGLDGVSAYFQLPILSCHCDWR